MAQIQYPQQAQQPDDLSTAESANPQFGGLIPGGGLFPGGGFGGNYYPGGGNGYYGGGGLLRPRNRGFGGGGFGSPFGFGR